MVVNVVFDKGCKIGMMQGGLTTPMSRVDRRHQRQDNGHIHTETINTGTTGKVRNSSYLTATPHSHIQGFSGKTMEHVMRTLN